MSRLRREGTPLRGERTRLRREESGRGCAARDEVATAPRGMRSRLRREESGRGFAARDEVATAPRGMRSRLRRERSGTRFEVRRRGGCFTGAPGVFGFFLCFPLRCWPARKDTYVRAAQPRSSSTSTCSRDAQRRPRPATRIVASSRAAQPRPVPNPNLNLRRAASPPHSRFTCTVPLQYDLSSGVVLHSKRSTVKR